MFRIEIYEHTNLAKSLALPHIENEIARLSDSQLAHLRDKEIGREGGPSKAGNTALIWGCRIIV